MDELTNLLREIYKDAYLQGRKDGLEGLYTEPQLIFYNYVSDINVSTKLYELGFVSGLNLCKDTAEHH